MGIERVLELLSIHGTKAKLPRLDAFAVIGDDHALPVAVGCIQTLRSMGVSVQMHAAIKDGSTGMKSQLKRADASGAQFALIFGSDEIARGTVTVKSLRDGHWHTGYPIFESGCPVGYKPTIAHLTEDSHGKSLTS